MPTPGVPRAGHPGSGFVSRGRRAALGALLAVVMGVAVLPHVAMGILSPFLIEDLGLSRAQVGVAVAVMAVVSAGFAMTVGRFADRIGGRSGVVVAMGLCGLGILGVALAPSYWLLLAAGVVVGLSQAATNPSANIVVVSHLPEGRRGFISGIKQAGEPAVIALAGGVLPLGAVSLGWRPTLAMAAALPVFAGAVALALLPRKAPDGDARAIGPGTGRLPPAVRWLAGYHFLMGIAAGSVNVYLPLYGHEAVGLDKTAAGRVMVVVGLGAVVFRVLWSHLTERARRYRRSLGLMSVGSALISLMFLAASWWGPVALWAAAGLWSACGIAFWAVGSLAIIAAADPARAGRASGLVSLGFGTGLAVGPPLFGLSVDLTGAYHLALGAAAGVFASAWGLVWLWSRLDPKAF